jgi:hypothetical protein
MYMARAPGSVVNWNGAGNVWFKIFEEGAKVDNSGAHFHTGTIRQKSFLHDVGVSPMQVLRKSTQGSQRACQTESTL